MQNFDTIIANSMLALKGVILTIIAVTGFSNTHSVINNLSNNTIQESTIEQSINSTEGIIGALDKKKNSTTPENVEKSKFKINKLNRLELIAEEYKTINTQGSQTKKIDSDNVYTQKYKELISTLNINSTNAKKTNNNDGSKTIDTKKQTGTDSGSAQTENIISPIPKIDINQTNTDDSVVNIRCENKSGNKIKVITGSGTLISKTGVILTAAHVAAPVYASELGQSYNCFARIKNPASEQFPVKTIFINPKWISDHFHEFEKSYSESGEHDFAFLKIDTTNKSFSNKKQSEKINLINKINVISRSGISLNSINPGDRINIIAYPASVYEKYGVSTALYRKNESNQIDSILTSSNPSYGKYLIETKNSSLGQSGASGGGIFDTNGNIIAVISNSVPSETSLTQTKIRAVLLSYINESLKQFIGKSISDLQ